MLGDLAGGDPKKQLNALWHYLAEGRNTRQPSGMVRASMEIVVGDEAVMLRRSVQDTGKRGISVGYPLKVNLTFDAENDVGGTTRGFNENTTTSSAPKNIDSKFKSLDDAFADLEDDDF